MDESIIGNKFHYLTVDGIEKYNGHMRYKCVCDCGNIVYTNKKRILSGRSKSCGCKRTIAIEKYQYLINKKINKWTVLSIAQKNGNTYCNCRCECGTTKDVNVYNLINGKSNDCGCGRKKKMSETKTKDIIGNRYGKLIVIKRINSDKNKRATYLCQCDCGNEIITSSNLLINGHTSSCGCLLSYYNSLINSYLNELNIKFIPEYTVEINNKKYRFDFWLPDFNLIIEYDGEQHYFPVNFGHSDYSKVLEDFKRNQKHDEIKNKYCTDNGINLLRIPYTEKRNIKEIIYKHLQRLSEEDAS